MNKREVRRRIASEMATYGAGLRRQRMLEEETSVQDDEFRLDDPEEDDNEE